MFVNALHLFARELFLLRLGLYMFYVMVMGTRCWAKLVFKDLFRQGVLPFYGFNQQIWEWLWAT